ncbi:iron chaperone [Oryzobacter telluris]|uniref:iron chaperone n=1 Tax=Oryzobacter telluris TaxID=3149179 RepID=UPI00370D0F69
MEAVTSVDEYLGLFSGEVRARLEAMRAIIRETEPEAVESMAYGMPAYKLDGKPLVYFAGYDKHVGFYATPNGHEAFAEELSRYKQGKGSVQFPHTEPLPTDLVRRVVEFRRADIRPCPEARG